MASNGSNYLDLRYSQYYPKGIIIDTNILLLLAIGAASPELLRIHRATRKYSPRFLDVARLVVSKFRRVLLTPNIVTEFDNLSRQIGSAHLDAVLDSVSTVILSHDESYLPSAFLIGENDYFELGVTDVGIIEIAKQDVLVFTDDLPLTIALEKRRMDVVNLNRLVL